MKKIMVLSCMFISMSMVNAMQQNETENGKKIKQEIPHGITVMDFYLPGMSPDSAQKRYKEFIAAAQVTSSKSQRTLS